MANKDHNYFSFIGRLTRDPETSFTPGGASICKFSVAVGDSYKSKSGDNVEHTNFFDCFAWGKRGEVIQKYCKKGKQVYLSGSIVQDRWEKDGQKHSRVQMRVEDFQFLADPRNDSGDGSRPAPQQRPSSSSNTNARPSASASASPDDGGNFGGSNIDGMIDAPGFDESEVPF